VLPDSTAADVGVIYLHMWCTRLSLPARRCVRFLTQGLVLGSVLAFWGAALCLGWRPLLGVWSCSLVMQDLQPLHGTASDSGVLPLFDFLLCRQHTRLDALVGGSD
jgi:hypothetical protein